MNYKTEYEQKKVKDSFSFYNPSITYMRVTDVLLYLKKNIWCKQYELITTEGKAIEGNFFMCVDLAEKIGAIAFRFMEAHVNQYIVNIEN